MSACGHRHRLVFHWHISSVLKINVIITKNAFNYVFNLHVDEDTYTFSEKLERPNLIV